MEPVKEIKPTDQVCMNCKHGRFNEQAQQVICHRFPPHPTLMNVPNPRHQLDPKQPPVVMVNQAMPPAVDPAWWCGEFARKVAS